MRRLSLLLVTMLISTPAVASEYVAKYDATLCEYMFDYKKAQAYLNAGDQAGIDKYFGGDDPRCIVVKKGETFENLDYVRPYVQLMRSTGSPRFIGWGELGYFE